MEIKHHLYHEYSIVYTELGFDTRQVSYVQVPTFALSFGYLPVMGAVWDGNEFQPPDQPSDIPFQASSLISDNFIVPLFLAKRLSVKL